MSTDTSNTPTAQKTEVEDSTQEEEKQQKSVKRGSGRTRGFKKSRGDRPVKSGDDNTTTTESSTSSKTQDNADDDDGWGETTTAEKKQRPKKERVYESSEQLAKKIADLKQQKLEKPDERKATNEVKQLTTSIEKLQEELDGVRKQIEEKDRATKKLEEERQSLATVKNEFSEKIKVLYKERDGFQEQIDRLEQEKDSLQNQRNLLQEDCPFKTLKQIEDKRKDLEDDLNECRDKRKEDTIIRQINKLDGSKIVLDKLVEIKDKIDNLAKEISDIKKNTKQKSDEIKKLKDERQQYFDKLEALKKKKKIIVDEKKKLVAKSDALRGDVDTNYKQMKAAKANQRTQGKKFLQYEKDLNYLQSRLEKQKEFEEKQKKREEREKRFEITRKKQEEFNKQWEEYEEAKRKNPYETEISLCTNLINYLEQILKTSNKIIKKEKTERILGKQTKSTTKNNINHPIDKFTAFNQLLLKPPTSYSQIEGTLQLLKEKRTYYNKFKIDDESTKLNPAEFAPITTVEADHITADIIEHEEENDIQQDTTEEVQEEVTA